MSDPRALWAAAAGTSKRKSVSMIWPELAAALGGESATAQSVPQPDCERCHPLRIGGRVYVRLARARNASGVAVCLMHAGDSLGSLRVAEWNGYQREVP